MTTIRILPIVLAASALGAGCGGAPPAPTVAARPYMTVVPSGYDASKPTPLVISLHGLGSDAVHQTGFIKLGALAEERTFLYAAPNGTADQFGLRFWAATDACCDFAHVGVDDVGYLNAVIDDMQQRYHVDDKRIFFVGHSNGAFMSHRMACEASKRIAAIVAVSGAQTAHTERCNPDQPVAVLDVHGNADETIAYGGGDIGGARYPSEAETMAAWAGHDGCTGALGPAGADLDLDGSIAGAETSRQAYGGCGDSAVELWTIRGGKHVPAFVDGFATTIYEWLSAHPKR